MTCYFFSNDDAIDEFFEKSSSNSASQKPGPDLSNIDPKILMPPPPPPPPSKSSPRYSDSVKSGGESVSFVRKQQLRQEQGMKTSKGSSFQNTTRSAAEFLPVSTASSPKESQSQSSSSESHQNCKKSTARVDEIKLTSRTETNLASSKTATSEGSCTNGSGGNELEEPPTKRRKSRLSTGAMSKEPTDADLTR